MDKVKGIVEDLAKTIHDSDWNTLWDDEIEGFKEHYREIARSFFKAHPDLYLKVLPDDVTTTIGVIPARNYFFVPISVEEESHG